MIGSKRSYLRLQSLIQVLSSGSLELEQFLVRFRGPKAILKLEKPKFKKVLTPCFVQSDRQDLIQFIITRKKEPPTGVGIEGEPFYFCFFLFYVLPGFANSALLV